MQFLVYFVQQIFYGAIFETIWEIKKNLRKLLSHFLGLENIKTTD